MACLAHKQQNNNAYICRYSFSFLNFIMILSFSKIILCVFCKVKPWWKCYSKQKRENFACKEVKFSFFVLFIMAIISKILHFILSYEVITFCEAYSSIIFLCWNAAIPTIHTIKSLIPGCSTTLVVLAGLLLMNQFISAAGLELKELQFRCTVSPGE